MALSLQSRRSWFSDLQFSEFGAAGVRTLVLEVDFVDGRCEAFIEDQ
jgi:hypothetical protein